MGLSEISKKIEDTINLISKFEEGDLIAIAEIEEIIKEIGKIGEEINVKNIDKLSNRLLKLFQIRETNPSSLAILSQILLNILELTKKTDYDEKKEIINNLNSIIPQVNNILKSYFSSTVKYKKKEYPENYFSNITTDEKMLQDFVIESLEHLDRAQVDIVELEYDTTDKEKIDSVFRAFHSIKGSSSFLGLKNIEEVSHELENIFSMVRDGRLKPTKEIIDKILEGIEFLRMLINIIPASNFVIDDIKKKYLSIDIYQYISDIGLITGHKKIGEILKEEGKIKEEDIQEILLEQIDTKKKFGEIAIEKQKVSEEDVEIAVSKQESQIKKFVSSYVKVSHERLNELIDNVGELVINQSMIKQKLSNIIKDPELERILNSLDQIITNMKNIVISMGMIPVGEIFNKIKVVIRNTAKDLNKLVNVHIEGEETELDKNVIEKIYDPLVHIIRNAIDHGIESPDEREKKGKSPAGNLYITASHKGNNIEIVIKDDGQGIDKDKVLKKGIDLGIVKPDSNLTDKEIYNLLFLSGFSTKEGITNISGRGVGLDVVKKNIESIKGRVEIESKTGEYTKFIIKIPLTLAIIEGFITRVGTNIYIFPFDIIEQIITVSENEINKMGDDYMIYHRGKHIPVVMAGRIFNERNYKNINNSIVLIIEYDSIPYGIAVDSVIGKQETVIKSLGVLFSNNSVFSGGTIFGDGTIGFVVDIEGFINKIKEMEKNTEQIK